MTAPTEPRLALVPATIALLDAELASPAQLASLLGAVVPEGWPPGEYDRPAIEFFRARLAAEPEAAGWLSWYALLRVPSGRPVLVGAGGFLGPPDRDGVVEVGYSILPAYAGRGLATELVRALVSHAGSAASVRKVIAHTTGDNAASLAVLRKAGFTFMGAGPEPGVVEYALACPPA